MILFNKSPAFFAWSTLMERNLTQKNVWISETIKYFPKNFCSNRKEFKIRKTTFSNVIFSHVFRNYNISTRAGVGWIPRPNGFSFRRLNKFKFATIFIRRLKFFFQISVTFVICNLIIDCNCQNFRNGNNEKITRIAEFPK